MLTSPAGDSSGSTPRGTAVNQTGVPSSTQSMTVWFSLLPPCIKLMTMPVVSASCVGVIDAGRRTISGTTLVRLTEPKLGAEGADENMDRNSSMLSASSEISEGIVISCEESERE